MSVHPLTKQLAGMRACHGVDHLMTMALRHRLVTIDGALWEIVEVYRETTARRIAAVKLPRKQDWSGAEVYFFRSEDIEDALADSSPSDPVTP